MYSPNRNPTELYYESHDERYALLRQEASNKRLARRPLATLFTMLVVLVVCVGLAAVVVMPGRAIDYVGTYLALVVGTLGESAVVAALLLR
jgi:hypothetical protein